MKNFFFLLFALSLLIPKTIFADLIYLKNGNTVEGVIEKDTGYAVRVAVNIGIVTYSKEEIESVSKAGDEENAKLKEKWKIQRQQHESEQEEWKKFAAEQEAKGLVLHDGKWITKEDYEKLAAPKVEEEKEAAKQNPQEQKPPEEKPKEEEFFKLVDKITFKDQMDNKTYNYAVRLPPKYNKRTKWPVIFCFDPGGNGEEAARRFAYAAENLGWIVVGSSDAKNGPWEPIISAQEAILKDIPKRFSVDEKRFYAGGFSGGARMSFLIAYRHPDRFKGVIACGAGFPDGTSYRVSKNVAVYRCVGKKDSNFDEVKELFGKLHLAGAKEHLREFEGGHDWPPQEVISDALDWLSNQ